MGIDYLASFVETDGVAFPNTAGKNASGPSAVDGTEFVKIFIDDIWGRFQAILDYASITPNGTAESVSNSQHIEALEKGFAIGPGIGVTYWKDGDPATNGDRVLLLQGQGVLIASYPELDAACYVGDGNNAAVAAAGGGFYRASDSAGTTPNIAGPYLILPESRGYAPRGLDLSATIDPAGASRKLGDNQADAMQTTEGFIEHRLNEPLSFGGVLTDGGAGTTTGRVSLGSNGAAKIVDFSNASSTSPNTAKTDDDETRMANMSVNLGVTY